MFSAKDAMNRTVETRWMSKRPRNNIIGNPTSVVGVSRQSVHSAPRTNHLERIASGSEKARTRRNQTYPIPSSASLGLSQVASDMRDEKEERGGFEVQLIGSPDTTCPAQGGNYPYQTRFVKQGTEDDAPPQCQPEACSHQAAE